MEELKEEIILLAIKLSELDKNKRKYILSLLDEKIEKEKAAM
ncbi:hypothetical protein [Clostridium saccharoperbutylacetonicum]